MGVVFMDSFNHYSDAEFTLKWTSRTSGAIAAVGRFGGNGYRFTGGAGNFSKTGLTSGDSTTICGFGLRTSGVGSSPSEDIIELGGASGGSVNLYMNSDGTIAIRQGASTVLGTSTLAISSNIYYHFEYKFFINTPNGTAELRVNGIPWITLTGLSLGTGTTNSIVFRQFVGASNDLSDFYLLDGTSPGPNDFIGDSRVEVIRPTAEGNTTMWVPNTGTNNALNVDDTTDVDDDTTHNSSASVNDVDTYVTGDLATTSGSVYAVQTVLAARKSNTGTREIASVVRTGGTDYVGANKTLGTTYDQHRTIYNQDPTSTNWTIASVNAAEYGVKMVT